MVNKRNAAGKPLAGMKGKLAFLRHVLGILEALETTVHDLDPDDDESLRFDYDPAEMRAFLGSDFGLDDAQWALDRAAVLLCDRETRRQYGAWGTMEDALPDYTDEQAVFEAEAEMEDLARRLGEALSLMLYDAVQQIETNGE
jgi:hypothetical protein